VPAGDAEQFLAAWEKTRDYLQRYPAHLDTALHQALGPDTEFQFVNIAHWRSAEEFTEAVSSPGFQEASAGLRWAALALPPEVPTCICVPVRRTG
jgi:heme-degrading monooxygenase HmoA